LVSSLVTDVRANCTAPVALGVAPNCSSMIGALTSEIKRLRARMEDLELQVAAASTSNALADQGSSIHGDVGRLTPGLVFHAPPGRTLAEVKCQRERRPRTNLVQLLPSLPGSDVNLHSGRCSRRYSTLESAWDACIAEPACSGVVKDNGIPCTSATRGFLWIKKKTAEEKRRFELRGGGARRGPGVAWVCPQRLARADESGRTLPATRRRRGQGKSRHKDAPVAALSNSGVASPESEGYLFIALGPCPMPDYDCLFLREARDAVTNLRKVDGRRPIAVVSDGGVPSSVLLKVLGVDMVTVINLPNQTSSDENADHFEGDARVRKLLAYGQTPFQRTVFMDGDTFVRSSEVTMLFDALGEFELAATFECCRVSWSASNRPFDKDGFFRGWELQTGVMAYKQTERVANFWRAAAREYLSRPTFWEGRSSGEQGAATLALARTDVRFLPLPPAFNARPYTMLQYYSVFGVPVYHGKELWSRKGLDGKEADMESVLRQRVLRDWDKARKVLELELSHISAGRDSERQKLLARLSVGNSHAKA
jgi:hypothetical protein